MIQVNIQEAKTRLSTLVDKASDGEAFIIARAGKPLVKVVPYDAPEKPGRLDCMRGLATVGKDVDIKAIAHDEITRVFYGEEGAGK